MYLLLENYKRKGCKVSIIKYWNIILRRRRKNFRSFLLKYSQNLGLGHSFRYVLGDTDKSNSADVAISIALKARNFFSPISRNKSMKIEDGP